jgi:hypothetical protein
LLRCIREVSEWFEGTPSVLLSAAAAAQIRAALLAVFEHTGGDPATDEHEPGLSPAMRELEAKARAALRLLDQAAPPVRTD